MKIARSNEMKWEEAIERGRFSQTSKQLSPGGGKIACGMYELPPGKTSFPLHVHYVTEEAMFVLAGSAKVRTETGEHAIGPGDYVTFPIGGAAHQLVNDGAEPLRYLGFSVYEENDADVVAYPDSKKFSIGFGVLPNRKRWRVLQKDAVDYFTGEE